MNDDEKRARSLARLDAAQRRTEAKLEQARLHAEKKFDQVRERILQTSEQPSDTQQRIIAAALELLDETGLNELSLRKLATKLDMQAPALYWHFKNKEALIDYMAEAILQEGFETLEPRTHDEPWQDWLVATMQRLRNAMRSHRDGARVVAGAHLYPAITLMQLFETSMQSLVSNGVEIRQANLIISTSVHFVFGNVIEEQAAPTLEEVEQFDVSVLGKDFPLMSKSVENTISDLRKGYDEFEDALRLIIGHAS